MNETFKLVIIFVFGFIAGVVSGRVNIRSFKNKVRQAMNTMQWVQEYIEAAAIGPKEVYIKAIDQDLDMLAKSIKEV